MGRTQVSVFLFMSVRAWQVEPQLVVLPAGHTHTHTEKRSHIPTYAYTHPHRGKKSWPFNWFSSEAMLVFFTGYTSFCWVVVCVICLPCGWTSAFVSVCLADAAVRVCVCVWGPSYPCVHACGVHAMSLCKLPALCRRCFRFCCRLSLVFYRFLVVLVVILPAYPCSFCLCSTPFSYFSCGCASSLAGFFSVSVF